ncbi:fatty acid desaturase [Phenylobacterium sp. LjRoot225]|uniref:fatty acid desaturase n=1 Tax=Phenylobacterium sp. LjRoot225 TaxID=3342285 RepID=UPI003ECD5455
MQSSLKGQAPGGFPREIEAATLLVAALIYGGWIALTLNATRLPPLLVATLGGWLVAWHGSLQHETIHGHPTPSRRFNALLGFPPLNLWLPYARYRQLHLAHHATERLTAPDADPESRYVGPGDGALRCAAAQATSTLLGRLVIGPMFEIGGFLASEAQAAARGEPGVRRAWAIHLAAVALVSVWLVQACGVGPGQYLLLFVYPGAALSLLRSFAEHRADPNPERRIAIVEKAPVLGLLFLNNNLHAVHHAFPEASWRRLPGLYAQLRTELLRANGGLVYAGYAEVFARYLVKPHDVLVHPEASAPAREPVAA